MHDVLTIAIFLGAKIAGTITDQLNWAMMGFIFTVAVGVSRSAIAGIAVFIIAAAFTAFHLTAAWELWVRAGVADASTVFTVVFTKAVFACAAYGAGRVMRRVFAHQ